MTDTIAHRISSLASTAMVARQRLADIRNALATAPAFGISKAECALLAEQIETTFAEIRALEGSNERAAA